MVANRIHKHANTYVGKSGPNTVEVFADQEGKIKFNDNTVVGTLTRLKKIPITRVAATTEQDTTVDLPAKALVLGVFIEVITAEVTGTTKTISVGTLSSESGGVAAGFVTGLSVASTGIKIPSLVTGGVTLGSLLKETVTDSGSATAAERVPYASTANTAKSISYTLASNNWAEFVGNICILYADF